MSLHRVLASCFLAISFSTSVAFAEGENPIVREPAQKKSVPASDDGNSKSTWGSGGVNGDFVNLRVAALGLLVGYVNLDLEFKLSDEWSIGPTLTSWKFDYDTSSTFTGNKLQATYTAFGARANWSQAGAYRTGVYISPMIQFVSAHVSGVSSATGRTVTGEASAPVVSGIVGYQWFNEGGFNVNIGAGLAAGTGGTKAEATDGVSTTKVETSRTGGLVIDFMLGYVF